MHSEDYNEEVNDFIKIKTIAFDESLELI